MTAIPRPRKPIGAADSASDDDDLVAPDPRLYSGIMSDGDTSGFDSAIQAICSSFVPQRPK